MIGLKPGASGQELVSEVIRIKIALIESATVKDALGAEYMAEAAALLIVRQRMLFNALITDDATAEDRRTFPALASNIKRLCECLGILTLVDDDLKFDFVGGDTDENDDESGNENTD